MQLLREDTVVSERVYLENGSRKHRWDLDRQVVHSYHSFSADEDPSAAHFLARSPSYTIYQYYGDSPQLLHIERYHERVRHGRAQYFHRNGQLKAAGEYDEWKKVGFWTYGAADGSRDIHWHLFNHGYYEGGLSVYYAILPFLLTLSLLALLGVRLWKRGRYPYFYRLAVLFPFSLFALWIVALAVLPETGGPDLRRAAAGSMLVIVHTANAVMLLLSLMNVVWAKRLHVRRAASLLCFFVGLAFSVFLIWLKVMAALAGVLVM